MRTEITPEFIRRIPKTDLHLHLDGSLRLKTLIELARQERVQLPSCSVTGLRETVFKRRYADLQEYLRGFRYTCSVMRTAENIERVACELAEDNLAEGVRYIEVRLAPQLHVHSGLTAEAVIRAVADGMGAVQRRHNASAAVAAGDDLPFHFGIIVCAMRAFAPQMGAYFEHLLAVMSRAPRQEAFAVASLELVREAVALRDELGLPIVGFDLAGEEAGYPAAVHVQAYQYAHRHFLKKTVHAGEAYGPESIFQAITDCHANRIGHGTFLFAHEMIKDKTIKDRAKYVNDLADYIASQRITMEVCLSSNLQTWPEIKRMNQHPFPRMLQQNLSVSICSDNRLVSDTTVSRELELAARHFCVRRHQFRNLILAGFKGSFFGQSYSRKRAYVRQAIELYERLERELLPPPGRG
jgi:adenosine deaminase